MKRIKKWILFFLLPLTGCVSYTNINLDVLKPAKINIPIEIASVVVVNNSPVFRSSDSVVHKINLPYQKYSIDTIWIDDFGKLATESFAEALKSRRFFDSVYVVSNFLKKRKNAIEPMSANAIDTLCTHYNAQAVISLDYYDYGTKIDVTEMPEFYYSTLDARSNTYWQIYDHMESEPLNVHVQRDTIFWESYGDEVLNSTQDLPSIRKAIENAAYHAGEKYAAFIAPTWQQEIRRFYEQGHPLFFDATELVGKGKWKEAGQIWYHIYQTGKGKQKARAAFNLALSQEVLGNFREATAWAWRSLDEYGKLGGLSVSSEEKKIAKSYYLILAQRLHEKKKIDEQYGVEE
jgi:hypothetical protein